MDIMSLNDVLRYTDALVVLGEVIAQKKEARDSYYNEATGTYRSWDNWHARNSELTVLQQVYEVLKSEDNVHVYTREAHRREDAESARKNLDPAPYVPHDDDGLGIRLTVDSIVREPEDIFDPRPQYEQDRKYYK